MAKKITFKCTKPGCGWFGIYTRVPKELVCAKCKAPTMEEGSSPAPKPEPVEPKPAPAPKPEPTPDED